MTPEQQHPRRDADWPCPGKTAEGEAQSTAEPNDGTLCLADGRNDVLCHLNSGFILSPVDDVLPV
jgi:hypothetical protein